MMSRISDPCYPSAFADDLACQPKLAQRAKAGADDRDRTGDLVLTKDALCQLSYIGSPGAQCPVLSTALQRFPHRAPLPGTVFFGLPAEAREASDGWSGRRGSNPRPTAWKAVTLPLSYSRLRASRPHQRYGAQARAARAHAGHLIIPPLAGSAQARLNSALSRNPAAERHRPASRSSRSERRLVGRGGFEPPKPLGRQIYSLLRLTAPQPPRARPPALSHSTL